MRAFRIGADDYLTKPFREEELVRRVERALLVSQAEAEHLRRPMLRGRLERMGLPAILMLLEHERKTGTLRLDSGSTCATLLIDDGRLVGTQLSSDPSADRDTCVSTAFEWASGNFAFDTGILPSAPLGWTDTESLTQAILDAAHVSDQLHGERTRRDTIPSPCSERG